MVDDIDLDEYRARYQDADVDEHQPFADWLEETLDEELEREIRGHGWRQVADEN